MITVFIILQIILLLFMALHDWMSVPPFNDISALKQHHSVKDRLITAIINSLFVLIPLGLTLYFYPGPYPRWCTWTMIGFYSVLTVGTLCAWWIPYLFGSSAKHKAGFAEYGNTHRFLPARGDNVIPNTLHVILHLLVWSCLVLSVYSIR